MTNSIHHEGCFFMDWNSEFRPHYTYLRLITIVNLLATKESGEEHDSI